MNKSLGQFLHDTAAELDGWARKWQHMSERQRCVWNEIARLLIEENSNRIIDELSERKKNE